MNAINTRTARIDILTFPSNVKYHLVTLLLISIWPLSAWGQTPEQARKELGQMNIPYNANAFIESAENGDIMVVKLFLASGMDVNVTKNAVTALERAIIEEQGEVINVLLGNGADPNANDGKALLRAIEHGNTNLVQELLEKGAIANSGVPFIVALNAGHMEIAKLLLSKGIDDPNVRWEGETPLTAAVKNGTVEIIQELLRRGANPNTTTILGFNTMNILVHAADKGNKDAIDALLKWGADVNADKGAALRVAVESEHYSAVKALLLGGADPNIDFQSWGYHNILSIAVSKGLVDIVEILLENKANPNVFDSINYDTGTPLMGAIECGALPIARLLLQYGANINAISQHRKTALLVAAEKRNEEAVKLLIESGADVNAVTESGATVLDYLDYQAAVAQAMPDSAYYFEPSPNIIQLLVNAG